MSSNISSGSSSSLVSSTKTSYSYTPSSKSSSSISKSSASSISSPSYSMSKGSTSSMSNLSIIKIPEQKKTFKFDFGRKMEKQQQGLFTTQVRRGGIFKTIGRTQTLGKALSLGSKRVSNTLAATFRIRGSGGKGISGFKLPKSIKQVKGKERTFMELPKFRLSSAGEKKEIKLARMMKI